MGRKDSNSQGSTRAQIIFVAVVMTPVLWWAIVAMLEVVGEKNPHLYASTAAAMLCGLTAWLTYHIVSRENNGLFMVVCCQWIAQLDRPFFSLMLTFLPFSVAMGGLFGLMARFLYRKRSRPRSSEPLFDPQLDQPAG